MVLKMSVIVLWSHYESRGETQAIRPFTMSIIHNFQNIDHLFVPRIKLTTSPWGCLGRCFRGCLHWGGSRGCWTSPWGTGTGSQRGTRVAACTSVLTMKKYKINFRHMIKTLYLRIQSPLAPQLFQSRKEDYPRLEKLKFPENKR